MVAAVSEPICRGCTGFANACASCCSRMREGLCVRCAEGLFDTKGEYLETAGKRFGYFCGPCFEQAELVKYQAWMEARR